MKAIISKILITGVIVAAFSANVLAGPTNPMAADTGKMSKMSKMSKMDKKMDKKMSLKKMSKDTGKMGKMKKM